MRSKQLNVSPDIYEAYWALAKWNKHLDLDYPVSTPDEIADNVLRKHVNDNHPQLFDQLLVRQKQVDALDKQLIEQLAKPDEKQES